MRIRIVIVMNAAPLALASTLPAPPPAGELVPFRIPAHEPLPVECPRCLGGNSPRRSPCWYCKGASIVSGEKADRYPETLERVQLETGWR
jgi:hypothetical protein